MYSSMMSIALVYIVATVNYYGIGFVSRDIMHLCRPLAAYSKIGYRPLYPR